MGLCEQVSPMSYLLQPLKYVGQLARSIYKMSNAYTEESAIFASCSYSVTNMTATLGPYKLKRYNLEKTKKGYNLPICI